MPSDLSASALAASIGPYRVVRELGAGATSRVFEAEHQELRKRVAIKVLLQRSAGAVARFLREGRAATRVRHPHVIDVFDVGTCEQGPYLVMALIEGGTLASRVPQPGQVDVETALAWLLPVLSAVRAAHQVGVIHRDLKPSNILVAFDASGRLHPLVSDFGVSKLLDEGRELTGADGVLGTPAYMAPEQILDPRQAGPAADQYSLGVMLYLFTTGHLPHDAATSFALMNLVVAGEFIPPGQHNPRLPPALGAAIARALQASPAARFPSLQALGAALLPFASPRTQAIWSHEFGELAPAPPARQDDAPADASRTLDTLDDRAPELPARRHEQTTRPGASRARWRLVAGAALALVASGLLLWRRTAPASDERPDFFAHATPARSQVEGVAQAYRLGLNAMRDSAWEAGVEHFTQAARLDPEFAAAHLRLAMAIASPEPPARRALARARVLRASLSERDRVFLESMEPLYFETPPDHVAHVARLRAGVQRFPQDAELTMHLAIALQSDPTWPEAERMAERALALEPGYPDALQTIARARAARGDIDGAVAGLTRCAEQAPLAVGCLRAHAGVLAGARRCEALPPLLRRWATVDPQGFEPHLLLAGVLAHEQRPWQSIEETLRLRWVRAAAEDRPTRERKDRIRLALYQGDHASAVAQLRELQALLEQAPDEESTGWAYEHLLWALEADRQPAEAARVAREFLARSQAQPGLLLARLRALSTALRLDPRDDDPALAAPLLAQDPASRPLVALAQARTATEANAALARLTRPPPPELADLHARALTLAGRRDEAQRVLRDAVTDCDGLALVHLACRLALAREP